MMVVVKEQTCRFCERRFPHNDEKCMEAQKNEFLETLRLHGGCVESCATPRPHLGSAKGEAHTPLKQSKLEDMPEQSEERTPKCKRNSKFGSPSPCKTPASASLLRRWAGYKDFAEEMPEQSEDRTPKSKRNSKFGSPSPYKTPASASRHMNWEDIDSVEFKLLETP